eukprot:365707-Chlamydomonas_euryale.AAC.10
MRATERSSMRGTGGRRQDMEENASVRLHCVEWTVAVRARTSKHCIPCRADAILALTSLFLAAAATKP